ncbi:MAG: DUF427 domain-containing protein [Solirubrobacteraceae bacterium]
MSASAPLIPGPDHPITIETSSAHVVVTAGATVVADSSNALTLHEANYPPVYYVPLDDVDSELLESSDTTSYCPYKGEASYYSVRTDDGVVEDAIWFYDEPYGAVSEIAGHVAFYPDRVQIDDSKQ